VEAALPVNIVPMLHREFHRRPTPRAQYRFPQSEPSSCRDGQSWVSTHSFYRVNPTHGKLIMGAAKSTRDRKAPPCESVKRKNTGFEGEATTETEDYVTAEEQENDMYHDRNGSSPSSHALDNPARVIFIQVREPRLQALLDVEDVNEDDSNLTGIPPDRPAEAFLDLKCWLAQGCMPSNTEYTDWLLKCVDSEYAFSFLLECWQGKGRFRRDKWKVAQRTGDCWSFETLDADEYESAKDRAYNMLHSWLGQEDAGSTSTTVSDLWHAAEKALPLFHECLEEAEGLDRCNPELDVSRNKVGYIRRAAWIANTEASREVKDAIGDELLLFLTVYELLRDLKREDEESDSESEWSNGSKSDGEPSQNRRVLMAPSGKSGELPPTIKSCNPTPSEVVSSSEDDDDEFVPSDDSNECGESVCAISTRVHCQGRGGRFKAIALMDILLSNATSDRWEPDLDVDLLKTVVNALGASEENPLNRKIVLPALSKVLSYWACRYSEFDEDHSDLIRADIVPSLQALKKTWANEVPSEELNSRSNQNRPTKRSRRARSRDGPTHAHHLRSEKAGAFTSLKDCASSFPASVVICEDAINALTHCIETLTWMLDEKCLEWMLEDEWRPETTY